MLAIFAYWGMYAMFWDLKFHLKANLFVKNLQHELPIFGGNNFKQQQISLVQFCNTSK